MTLINRVMKSSHVRQLIYIALYPPPPAVNDDEDFRPDLGSPSKLASRQHRHSVGPTPADSEAASSLLMAFAYTNTPRALMRALPSYSASVPGRDQDDENHDSFIAREATRIKNAKSCWEILKSDFVKRSNGDPATPRIKKRHHRRKTGDDDDAEFENVVEEASIVAPTAWSVLDWLLAVFEKEESLTAANGERE